MKSKKGTSVQDEGSPKTPQPLFGKPSLPLPKTHSETEIHKPTQQDCLIPSGGVGSIEPQQQEPHSLTDIPVNELPPTRVDIEMLSEQVTSVSLDEAKSTLVDLAEMSSLIGSANPMMLAFYQKFLRSLQQQNWSNLPIKMQVSFLKGIQSFSDGLDVRTKQLAQETFTTPGSSTIVDPQDTKLVVQQSEQIPATDAKPLQPVQFHHLHQFIRDNNTNIINKVNSVLPKVVISQINRFQTQGLIYNSRQKVNAPLSELFVRAALTAHDLTSDQCQYIIKRTSPLNEKFDHDLMDFPFYNPDFQFSWMLPFVNVPKLLSYSGFVEPHVASQLALPKHKDLTYHQVHARFAFQAGCRWILWSLDPIMNILIDERYTFTYVNGTLPVTASRTDKEYARVFNIRDMHTSATDGQNQLIFAADESAFMAAFQALQTISPVLKFGSSSVNILVPNALPHLTDLPPPNQYEQLIPIHCTWSQLTKFQLVPHLRQTFTPCIGFGGYYLPRFADANTAVQGRLIVSLPKFATLFSREELKEYFTWSPASGSWLPFDGQVEMGHLHDEYMNVYESTLPVPTPTPTTVQMSTGTSQQDDDLPIDYEPPSDDEKKPSIPLTHSRIYGSNHFFTWFNRSTPKTQITISPSSIKGPFCQGFDPFKPLVSDDPFIDNVLTQNPVTKLKPRTRDILFGQTVSLESKRCVEIAIRYRRSQYVRGFDSPYLSWSQKFGNSIRTRAISSMELLQLPPTSTTLNFLRGTGIKDLQWIPKSLAPHYDETSDSYIRDKRQLQLERSQRSDYTFPSKRPKQTYGHLQRRS